MSLFIRKRALRTLRDILNNKPIVDDDGIGNGRILTAVNRIVDVANLNVSILPIVCVVPAPHTVKIGLLGKDNALEADIAKIVKNDFELGYYLFS